MSEAAPPSEKAAGLSRSTVPREAVAYVELSAMPLSAHWARHHTQAVLSAWRVPAEAIEISALLVSELVTNAVAATTRQAELDPATAPIVQTLRRQPGRLVIEVSDSDPHPPVLDEAAPDAESGRGLMLVQALSKEWSYFFPPSGGKTIYCVINVCDPTSTPANTRARP